MVDANLNAWWCRLFWRQLIAAGVERILYCPGNRNLPLGCAAEACDELQLSVQQEERSAAFIALGHCLASGRPTAVCTTSGSAVANCLPALAEAVAVGAPLLLISADRPACLQNCEAPQTMPQLGCSVDFRVAGASLPEPAAEAGAELLAQLTELVEKLAVGPVHVNVPLDDPLPPLPLPGFIQPADPPPVASRPARAPATSDWPAWARPGLRGLIVAGPRCPIDVTVVDALARATGFPVLADAASELRRPAVAHLVCLGDALASGRLGRHQADCLIRLGPAPIARPMWEYCQRHRGPVLRIADAPVPADFCHAHFDCAVSPDAVWLERLGDLLADGDDRWRQDWLTAEDRGLAARADWLAEADWGEVQAAALIADHAGDYDLLHLANSMAVRHGNLHLLADERPLAVFANRGVNGIDGTVATFLGELLARPRQHGLLLLGDLAFLHDLPALAAAAQQVVSGTITVINNNGGGIFDLLPGRDLPEAIDLLRAPAPIDIGHSAAQFGLGHRACFDAESLAEALAWSRNQRGVQVVEVQVPAESLRDEQPDLVQRIATG